MLDQLRPLAVFAKTVETGSFRAAASALKLSPSVVSHHVAQLEARLGVALLYRSTRRLALTRVGERLFQSARVVLEAAETGLDSVASQSRQPIGELRITAPAVLSAGLLVDDIAAFAATYPGVHLSLSFSDLRRDLLGGSLDLAIRMGRLRDSALKAKKLYEVRRTLVAAAAYVADRPAPRRPLDLTEWDWLHLASVPRSATLTRSAGRLCKIDFVPRLTVDDAIALYRLARSGLGLAMAPEFLAADDLAKGVVVEVLPNWRLDAIGVYAVWPPNAPRQSLTARFVAFLDQRERVRRDRLALCPDTPQPA